MRAEMIASPQHGGFHLAAVPFLGGTSARIRRAAAAAAAGATGAAVEFWAHADAAASAIHSAAGAGGSEADQPP